MDSPRGCPVACCGKLLAIAALILVPVAAVFAVSALDLPSLGHSCPIAAQDSCGLDIVEPSLSEAQPATTEGDSAPVERQARDWAFTDGPRPSSNR